MANFRQIWSHCCRQNFSSEQKVTLAYLKDAMHDEKCCYLQLAQKVVKCNGLLSDVMMHCAASCKCSTTTTSTPTTPPPQTTTATTLFIVNLEAEIVATHEPAHVVVATVNFLKYGTIPASFCLILDLAFACCDCTLYHLLSSLFKCKEHLCSRFR